MKDQADRQMDDIDWLRERLNNTMKTIGVQTVTGVYSNIFKVNFVKTE